MQHTHIVPVFDFGSHGDSLYYVMSLVDGWGLDRIIGGSPQEAEAGKERTDGATAAVDMHRPATRWQLSQTMAKTVDQSANGAPVDRAENEDRESTTFVDTGKVNPDRTILSSNKGTGHDNLWHWVAGIGIQAADALAYAHSMGVVHRDIKPSNLMIDADNHIYVTDFGLAKVADTASLTGTGDLLGTLRYMPPESFSGNADHRSDVYGLGMTLYELLADQPTFKEIDRGSLISAISDGRVARLQGRVPGIPRDLQTVIHKAIDVDPAARYQTAGEFRDDLKRYLTGQPIQARQATWVYKSARWIGRNKVVSGLAASVFVLLAAAAIFSSISANRFENLAGEKESQRVAAREAEAAADLKTRESQLNLLAAKLSDARGWSTSRLPGQKVEGTKALKEAIRLSRELDVFEQHRFSINEIASTLSTLCDLPEVISWRHPSTSGTDSYTGIGFNRDLSEYAFSDYRNNYETCDLFRVAANEPELLETIKMPEGVRLYRYWIKFSHDSNFVFNVGRTSSGKNVPWIYDRVRKKHILPEFELSQADTDGHIDILQSGVVTFVNSKNELVGYDLNSEAVKFQIALPETANWSHLSVSRDSSKIAIYKLHSDSLLVFDVKSQKVRRLKFTDGNIRAVHWRPDDIQLAVITTKNQVSIWNLYEDRRNNLITNLEQETGNIGFSNDGRFLLSTGWSLTTTVHSTTSGMPMLRLESFLLRVSDDGRKAVFEFRGQLEIRELEVAKAVSDFYFPDVAIQLSSVADPSTGLFWAYSDSRVMAIDMVKNRVAWQLRNTFRSYSSVAVDPKGRDIFVTSNESVFRLPVKQHAGKSRINIGPPEDIFEKPEQPFSIQSIRLNATGQQLAISNQRKTCEVVLNRNQDWNVNSHTHATAWPTDLHLHPTEPLVVTTVHHGLEIEVRNTNSDSVEFSIQSKGCRGLFTPDGKKLIVAKFGSLAAYEVGTWKKISQSESNWRTMSYNAAVSNDSQWIAVENQNPRGVMILDQNLQPAMLLRGNHLQPRSNVGQFDPSGRFLVCNRGKHAVGVWDFYKLRQHFESLDLEWPLEGLGNPTPLRDPEVPVEIIWESRTQGAKQAVNTQWLIANKELPSITSDVRIRINRFYSSLKRILRSNRLEPLDVRNKISVAIKKGSPVFNAGDHQQCCEIYFKLLNSIRSAGIEDVNAELMELVSNGIEKAQRTDSVYDRAWALRHCLDDLAAKLKSDQTAIAQ